MRVPSQADVNAPINTGSVIQVELSASKIGLPTIILSSDSEDSNIILNNGYRVFSIGMTSSQDGILSVQRYLDEQALIPQDGDNSFNVDLTAGQPATLNITDGKPFQSMKISVSNSGGSSATISPFILLLQAY